MIPKVQTAPDPTKAYVVLFDIDGTLLTGPDRGPSAGLLAMNAAAQLLTGAKNIGDPREFAGRTDTQIARMLLQIGGQPNPSQVSVDQLVQHYIESLREQVSRAPYTALGNPRAAVGGLESRGALVGLGTGNVRSGAKIKLKSAGIDDLFDFDRSGFGDDGHTRSEVLRIGASRCDPGRRLPVIIVGDTPRDVAAAKEIGAFCIATPHHSTTAEMLKAAGADAVVETVDEQLVEAVFSLVGFN